MAGEKRRTPTRKQVPKPEESKFVPRPAAVEQAPPGPAPGESFQPYIPASKTLPELTIKVFVVGIVLALVMASANAYLGLYAALTVSAAIPASVISMAVLRFFRERNILENNLVQTTASAGESVTAGIIFTLPGLLVLGYWREIGIIETMIIAALGGSLGVLFTIPLRRAFIVEAKLQYPEGVATVEVLKSGEKGGSGVGYILLAGILGAVYKFMQGGFGLWIGIAEWAKRLGNTGVFVGGNLSPALMAVGFIITLPIAVLIFAGGFISYGIAIPIYLAAHAWPTYPSGALAGLEMNAVDAFGFVRGAYVRYIGVGAMATGGVYTLFKLRHALVKGIQSGLDAYKEMRASGKDVRPRTERDITMRSVLISLVIFVVPLTLLFTYFVTDEFRQPENWWIGLILGVVMMAAAFLFSAVAGYMAGVVGSSNNPISGTAIGTILLVALLLVGLGLPGNIGAAATILIGATIAAAAAIAGDNMQDLKAGYLLGGTPKNLQITQMLGAIVAALVIPFILILLDSAYGIGVRPQCDPSSDLYDANFECKENPLAAPQASLMAAIAGGIFGTGIPWDFFLIGVGVAVAIIALDLYLASTKAKFRTPVLAVAVGIYLPFDLATPIFLGGLIWWFARRNLARTVAAEHPSTTDAARGRFVDRRLNRGVLFGSGLIAGESLMGIALAGLIVAGESVTQAVSLFDQPVWFLGGTALLFYLAYLLYHSVTRGRPSAQDVSNE